MLSPFTRRASVVLVLTLSVALATACGDKEGDAGGDKPTDVAATSQTPTPVESSPSPSTESPIASPTPSATSAASSAQAAALEAYVAQMREQIPQLLEEFADTYKDIQFNAIGSDTAEYAYFYLEEYSAADIAAYNDGRLADFQENVDSVIIPRMVESGVTDGPKVMFTYYNPDGSVLWTHTFEASRP